MFIAGDLQACRKHIAQQPKLAAFIQKCQHESPMKFSYTTKIATDDWPYIYLKDSNIPILYYCLAGLMILLLIRSRKHWRATELTTRWNRSHWHFLFLGAAFLLLEVQNISKAAVVLGNTWEVNAVIISGVLVMILLANLIEVRFSNIPLNIIYGVLIANCIGLYFVDLAWFAFLPIHSALNNCA